jgi:hypothetical protein
MKVDPRPEWARLAAGLTAGLAVLCAALLCGCEAADSPGGASAPSGEPQLVSPDAKIDTHEMLRMDLDAPRHPADGGGRAWLVPEPDRGPLRVSTRHRFDILYEAWPLGIA